MGGVGGHRASHSKQYVVLCVSTCFYSCRCFILHYPSGKGRTHSISASLIIFLPSFLIICFTVYISFALSLFGID